MLRVCGVTFDHTTNYGSCLQAYALQTAVEKITIGNLSCRYELLPYSLFCQRERIDNNRTNIKNLIKRNLIKTINTSRRKKIISFEQSRMHYVDCHNENELSQLDEKYDAFVCGSDVIWNPDFTDGNEVYFLNFARKYKFSYAASFGVRDIFTDYHWNKKPIKQIFIDNLSKLDAISVRANNDVEIVRSLIGKNPELVCDPVILLTPREWDDVCKETKGIKEKYIFVYSTYISPNLLSFIKKLHIQTSLRVIHITWDNREALKRGLLKFTSPLEWISLLKNAEYVITNSFHGVAFCAMYHKKFYAVMRDERIIGTRIRIYDFCERTFLTERIYGIVPEVIDTQKPDFCKADYRIDEMRKAGLLFIERCLYESQNKAD